MWKQGIGLKDCVDIPLVGWDIIDPFPIKVDISSRRIQRPAMILRMVDFLIQMHQAGIKLPFFQFKIDIL